MISLAGGIPDPTHFPTRQLAGLAAEVIEREGSACLQYGLTNGEMDLRESIAAHHGAVEATQVVVTTGSQQGLDLIARVLVEPGDVIVCGDPDYLGALQAFRSSGAQVVAVPIDSDGIRVDALEGVIAGGVAPKAVYIVPHFHNPTGASLSMLRRAALAQLAGRRGFLVIEDDPYRDLHFDVTPLPLGEPPPNVVHLGSVSKTLAPGLRVGWMVGPDWLLGAVQIAKQSADLHTSTLSQALARRAMVAAWYEEHVADLRRHYRRKRDAFVEALDSHFGDAIDFEIPSGGMFVWGRLRSGLDTQALLPGALDQGVAYVPGAAFAVEADLSSHVRLAFATVDVGEITEAVLRLRRSLLPSANVVAAR